MPSLLDMLDSGDDGFNTSLADLPDQIDLIREVERGWPINPADADSLTRAFNALGYLPPQQSGETRPPDSTLFSAIERFQQANGVEASGNMARGGMTILHLNKALKVRKSIGSRATSMNSAPFQPRRTSAQSADRSRPDHLHGATRSIAAPPIPRRRVSLLDASPAAAAVLPAQLRVRLPTTPRPGIGVPSQPGTPTPLPPNWPWWLFFLLTPFGLYYQELERQNRAPDDGSGGNLRPPHRGGSRDGPNFCYERWQYERDNCFRDERNYGDSNWRLIGCLARAADRHNMCRANGGTPGPREPNEWNPSVDAPNDPPPRNTPRRRRR